MINNNN